MICKDCQSNIEDDCKYCTHCGKSIPLNIGGFLYFVGFNVLLFPIAFIYSIIIGYPDYSAIFTDGVWDLLTTKGNEYYNPKVAYFIVFSLITTLVAVCLSIYNNMLFFTKKLKFPKYFISLLILSFVISVSPIVIGGNAEPSAVMTFLWVLFFVYYFNDSDRSKRTFVN